MASIGDSVVCWACSSSDISHPNASNDAVAECPSERNGVPHFCVIGGGDDWGVVISGNSKVDHRVTIDFHIPLSSRVGRDARAMVRALQAISGWSRVSDLKRVSDHGIGIGLLLTD